MNKRRAQNEYLFNGINIDDEEDNAIPRGPRKGARMIVEEAPDGVLPPSEKEEEMHDDIISKGENKSVIKNKVVSIR